MSPWALRALTFSAVPFAAVIGYAAIGAYVLDDYEVAWGRGPSVQVASWLGLLWALLVLLGAGSGFSRRPQRAPSYALTVVASGLFIFLSVPIARLSSALPQPTLLFILWSLLAPFLIAYGATYADPRRGGA